MCPAIAVQLGRSSAADVSFRIIDIAGSRHSLGRQRRRFLNSLSVSLPGSFHEPTAVGRTIHRVLIDFRLRLLQEPRARGSMTLGAAMTKNKPTAWSLGFSLLAALALAALSPSPARADRCEDIANQLKSQIDGLKVNFTAARIIYLSHPKAKELSLGCRGRDYSNELYAKADSRKPKPEFYELVANAAAIIFTIPKPDVLTGATRCIKRMGLLRGDKVNMRYRRLDMECTRTKTEAAIAISRGRDE
jgi:hypothetical protein